MAKPYKSAIVNNTIILPKRKTKCSHIYIYIYISFKIWPIILNTENTQQHFCLDLYIFHSTINDPVSKHGFYSKRQKYSSSFLVLTWGESFPEEVAAACFALSLGERNVSPHHLLLFLQLWDHLVSSRCHQLRHKLEQEQVSEILKKSNKENKTLTPLTSLKVFSIKKLLKIMSLPLMDAFPISPTVSATWNTLCDWLTLSFAMSALSVSVSKSLRGAPLTCTSSTEENKATRSSSTWERSIFRGTYNCSHWWKV